jgi:ADP-heptose:LPS heptosyltransferase
LKKNKGSNSKKQLRALGLDKNTADKKTTIKEVLDTTPGMVTVQAERDFVQAIDDYKIQVKKNDVLVLPLNVYNASRRYKEDNSIVYSPYRHKFSEYFNRYRGENLDGKRLLVWRSGGIGDIMFSQPIIKYLKEKYPTCHITYATLPRNASLLVSWPKGLLDNGVIIPFPLSILKEHDYHLTFEGSIERCKEAESVNCYDIFQMMANLKFNPLDYPIELTPIKTLYDSMVNIFKGTKVIMLQPRATSILRTLPLSMVEELIFKLQKLGLFVGLQDSFATSEKWNSILHNMKSIDQTKILNLSAISKDVAYAVSIGAHVVGGITTDSAFSHILPALGKPVVTIYGPFKGELRMQYYKNADWINTPAEWNECGKNPCFFHESEIKNCPYVMNGKSPMCMSVIDVDMIIKKYVAVHNEVYPNDKLLFEDNIPG